MTKENRHLTEKAVEKARILSEALPFMRRYAGETVVIKYGGHAMGNDDLARLFATDIVLLKQVGVHPIVVHGGGPQIGEMLEKMKIRSSFVDGLRVTDSETVEVVNVAGLNYDVPSGLLEPNTTYLWRVEARNPYRKEVSPTWQFTTASASASLAPVAFGLFAPVGGA